MNLKKYNKKRKPLLSIIKLYSGFLVDIDNRFILAQAPYPPGTKLLIKDFGDEREVVIHYEVKDGQLVSKFMTLEGKHVFTHQPKIIKEL